MPASCKEAKETERYLLGHGRVKASIRPSPMKYLVSFGFVCIVTSMEQNLCTVGDMMLFSRWFKDNLVGSRIVELERHSSLFLWNRSSYLLD